MELWARSCFLGYFLKKHDSKIDLILLLPFKIHMNVVT